MNLKLKFKRVVRGLIFVSQSVLKKICLFCCFKKMSTNSALTFLESFSPNPNSSSIYKRDGSFDSENKYDLSVIISTFNNAPLIKKCLDSILNQKTNYSYEIIVVNDGSTDKTLEVLKAYNDIDNVVIISQKNQGLSAGRNTGINIAKGKYIMFVDGDDYLPNDTIQVLLDSAYKYDSDIAFGGFNSVSSNENLSICLLNYNEGIIDSTINLVTGFAWGKVYKKTMWDNLCFPIGYLFEDSINAIIMSNKAKIVSYVNKPIYNYVSNQYGITHTARKKVKAIDSYWIVDTLYKDKIKLGFKLSAYDLGYIFRQIKLTYSRTKFLKTRAIKSLFYMWCDFVKKYDLFQYDINNIYAHTLLGGALIKKSWFKFILAMPLI